MNQAHGDFIVLLFPSHTPICLSFQAPTCLETTQALYTLNFSQSMSSISNVCVKCVCVCVRERGLCVREMCVCGMCACVDGKGKVGAVHNARSPSVFPFLVVVWHGGFVGFSLCRVSRFDLWRCHCQCSFHRMWFALLSFSLACAFFPFSLLAPTPFFLTPAPKANSQHEVSAMCAAVVCSVVVCFVACSLYHHGLCRVRCCVHPLFSPRLCLFGWSHHHHVACTHFLFTSIQA